MEKLKFGDKMSIQLVAAKPWSEGFNIRSLWTTECYRKGKLIWTEADRPNVCTTEGINHMLDVTFHNVTAVNPWYIALIENSVTPLISWTYDLLFHTQAAENVEYDEAARVAYNEAAASSKVTTNSANKATFTMNAGATIYGAALVSVTTWSDHGIGTCFCVSNFDTPRDVVATDVLKVTVTITGADT